jgi:hypothetical protein
MVEANGASKKRRINPMRVTYGDFMYDSEMNPTASTIALLSRGLAHYLGNEVSARVGASFKKDAIETWKVEHGVTEVDKATRASIESTAIPNTDSMEYTGRKASIVAEFIEALRAGSVGIRERAASVDPFEAEVQSIAKAKFIANLRQERTAKDGTTYRIWSGRADPKADSEIVLADKTWTFGEALAAHVAKRRDEYEKAAHKRIAERNKGLVADEAELV